MLNINNPQTIIDAINRHEFCAYIQKIVDAKTLEVIGGEALARWEHPKKGILTPNTFIKPLIQSGSISALDFYMFEEACKQQEVWQKQNTQKRLSCNFTRTTLSDHDFIHKLNAVIEHYPINYSQITAEITEDAQETSLKISTANIAYCKSLGMSIAIDDMGSGFSSMNDLQYYCVDIVKIDRSILLNAITPKGLNALNKMINTIHKLGKSVLCEGVETLEQVKLLKTMGCDYMQGYYFGRPEKAI